MEAAGAPGFSCFLLESPIAGDEVSEGAVEEEVAEEEAAVDECEELGEDDEEDLSPAAA
jgi:hypothetical protein